MSAKTLAEIVEETRRLVVADRIANAPSLAAAARSLGITREGLWKLRRRYGIESEHDGARVKEVGQGMPGRKR